MKYLYSQNIKKSGSGNFYTATLRVVGRDWPVFVATYLPTLGAAKIEIANAISRCERGEIYPV